MGIIIYEPGNEPYDDGSLHQLYPIEETIEAEEVVYDQQIQRTAYIQANIVACFDEWIHSFFEPNYFKYNFIKSQVPFSQFKSFMKGIYKHEMPLMVIDPRSIEHVEDSIFGLNMTKRYNMIDPANDLIGAKLLYSIDILKTDMCELYHRRNRYRFEFGIMIMERTMNRQINTYNMMLMNFRHDSKFPIYRTVPHLLPSKYIINIANLHGYDWKSDKFLKFLNSVSTVPIIKRILPNGQNMFFMEQKITIQVEIPSLPEKDSPEKSEAIEMGARIVDAFTFIVDLPSEFIFTIPKQYMTKYDRSIPEDPEDINYISPLYADLDWPKEIGDYKLANRLDIMHQLGEDVDLNILPTLEDCGTSIYTAIKTYIDNKGKINDLIEIRVFPNGSYDPIGHTLSNAGIMSIVNPEVNKLYTVCIYLNMYLINTIISGENREFIGTMEQY